MKKTITSIVLMSLCAALSFTIVLQLKSVSSFKNQVQNTQVMRAEQLQSELTKETKRKDELYQQLLKHNDELAKFREEAAQSSDYASFLNKQLEEAELLAGLTDVEGTGVIITMRDSPLYVSGSAGQEDLFIIHDEDLLKVVNELRDAGAEAISINDERLLSTSEMRCAGSTVSVNNNRYAAPYIIKAIGSPENLEYALRMPGGVSDVLARWGIELAIEQKDKLIIKAYTGVIQYKYATAGGDK